jgi:hypothetical protein
MASSGARWIGKISLLVMSGTVFGILLNIILNNIENNIANVNKIQNLKENISTLNKLSTGGTSKLETRLIYNMISENKLDAPTALSLNTAISSNDPEVLMKTIDALKGKNEETLSFLNESNNTFVNIALSILTWFAGVFFALIFEDTIYVPLKSLLRK